MRVDHIAYRVSDKHTSAQFFIDAFGYTIADEFQINFDDGSCAQCYALTPPERINDEEQFSKWSVPTSDGEYHLPPEIFVSEGTPGSIVDEWVKKYGSGVHHIAYQVQDVASTMNAWKEKGWATFTTEEPISADGLVQCFTEKHPLTGIIYELIYRTKKGFNINNVKDLMTSTVDQEDKNKS